MTSYRTSGVLLLVYAAMLAVATWVEKYEGTSVARELVYHSPAHIVLSGLLVTNVCLIAVRRGYVLRREWPMLVTHIAFVVMLAGALTTHLCSREGTVHIREGETTDEMLIQEKGHTVRRKLPFAIGLENFILTRYPGSDSPSAYESRVVLHTGGPVRSARVSMNHVLDVQGYRFFQASYDPDERGTVLAVNYDIPGRYITYTGYVLLALGMLLSLVSRRSRFRRLVTRLADMQCRNVILLSLFLLPVAPVRSRAGDAGDILRHCSVPEDHAGLVGRLPVQSAGGRMMPLNTFASEVLRKLHKSDNVFGMDADRFMVSLWALPDVWMRADFIAVPGEELARRYGLDYPYCSYVQLFDGPDRYKLQDDLEAIYRKHTAKRSASDKEILQLDERANILNGLILHRMPKLFPLAGDAECRWYGGGDAAGIFCGRDSLFVTRILDWYADEVRSAWETGQWKKAGEVLEMIDTYQQVKHTGVDIRPVRMQVEIVYNRLQVFRYCKIGYLMLGGLCLLGLFVCWFTGRRPGAAGWLAAAGLMAVFLFHLCGMCMRAYIGGFVPWSNSYETLVYAAWMTMFAGWLFVRRTPVALVLSALMAGVILFVAGLQWMDPQITPLVPVLRSPWLMFHVAVVVAAYGFFGLGCLLGIVNLLLMAFGCSNRATFRQKIAELSLLHETVLWPGLVLMTAGTFIGAVWANESWGRYWGWDPKETWALVTILLYAAVTHLHLVPVSRRRWWLNVSSVLAFQAVLMTYFGVNYFLSGMHAYGTNEHISALWLPLACGAAAMVVLCVVSYIRGEECDRL